jgi:hypothetical protein
MNREANRLLSGVTRISGLNRGATLACGGNP